MATASGSERLGRRWMGRAPNAHDPWLKPAKTPEDGRYHEDRGSTWPARSWVLPHLPLPTGKSSKSTERKGFRPSRVVCTLSRHVTRPEGSSPSFSPAASPSPTPALPTTAGRSPSPVPVSVCCAPHPAHPWAGKDD